MIRTRFDLVGDAVSICLSVDADDCNFVIECRFKSGPWSLCRMTAEDSLHLAQQLIAQNESHKPVATAPTGRRSMANEHATNLRESASWIPEYPDEWNKLNAAANELDRLTVALAERERELAERWQPIEAFVPTPDECDFLVCVKDYVGEARWQYDHEAWYWAGNDPTDSWGAPIFPTHWQPLPAPPAGEAK